MCEIKRISRDAATNATKDTGAGACLVIHIRGVPLFQGLRFSLRRRVVACAVLDSLFRQEFGDGGEFPAAGE